MQPSTVAVSGLPKILKVRGIMASAIISIDIVKGFLEEGHPLFCGETARRIISRGQKLLEREIARGLMILYLCDCHKPDENLIVAREAE